MRTPIPLTAALFVVLILGCMGKDKDADTDVEPTDTDNGEVVDTDTEPDFGFTGAVTLYRATDGEVDCDVEADLFGIDYTGGCAGCDFKFTVTENITRDDSPGRCKNYMAAQTYIGEGLPFDVLMAHADTYVLSGGPYGTTPYPYYDSLLAGLVPGPSYGPRWYLTTYEDGAFGTFSREGDTIEWSFSDEYEVYYKYGAYPNYYEICGALLGYSGSSFGGLEGTSGLDCDGAMVDMWEVVSDGSPLDISADTLSADTTFDFAVWVNDPTDCTLAVGSDDFPCAFPAPAGSCPSLQVADDMQPGTYQVVVRSFGACAGATAEYVLRVDGVTSLELVKDDIDVVVPFTAEKMFEISGTGTIWP